jgi:hypothetical protein
MQIKERSISESLPNVLDQALAQLNAGVSIEECLTAYPQHAAALEPLLRAGDLLHAQANIPLPAEMDDWLATGALDFAAIAAQMAPKYAKPPQTTRQRVRATAQAQQQFDEILDLTLARAREGMPLDVATAEYPAHSDALAPLVRLGLGLQADAKQALPAEMTAWLPQGRREFMAIAEQMAPRYARRRQRAAARRLTAQRAAVAVVVVAVAMGAVDSASAQSLPGDTLYQWKRAKENISLALAVDPDQRSQLLVEYANRRLDEFNDLIEGGNSINSVVIAETLDSLLESAQNALSTNRQNDQVNVSAEVRDLLVRTKHDVQEATPALPDTQPVLARVIVRADQLAQEIPATPPNTAAAPTNTAVSDTSTPNGSSGGNTSRPGSSSGNQGATATATPIPPSPAVGGGAAQPTATGPINVPLSPTSVPVNTATPDPATALPPTTEPSPVPTDEPAGTAQPTSQPGEPTSTVIPTATAVPVTEVPSEVPPPTVPPTSRPTRVPPTDTPTDVPTDTPTDVPTNTPTDVPTDTPTDVPTNTPTDVPTDTPTDVPTDTPTDIPTLQPTAAASNSTATAAAGPSANSTETASAASTPEGLTPTP